MREDDRLPRFNRYSIPPRDGTVQCDRCPAWVKPEGMRDHFKAKHPEVRGVYAEMCADPSLCSGKGYCPRDPTCAD